MRITLNGKTADVESETLFSLLDELGEARENLVVIKNGYAVTGDLPIKKGDELVFIKKGAMPEKEALEAMLCARHTPGVYEKVRRARAGVAGLGGLGSHIAIALARIGVGHLHLIDFDTVEPSNLNRQAYGMRHLNMHKAEALREMILDINPYVDVQAEVLRITEKNASHVLRDDDIILEAFDAAEEKAMLVNTILSECPQKIVIAASGMAGYGSGNGIYTRKAAKRLYICGDGETGAKEGCGLMSPRVLICAGHQANMALRVILGKFEV